MYSIELTKTELKKILKDEYFIFKQMNYDYDFIFKVENNLIPLNVPESNLFSMLNGQDNRLKFEKINGYQDVYSIDMNFLKNSNGFVPLGFFENNKYMGHTWIKSVNGYNAIYGIRTSLENTIMGIKGNSKKFLNILENIEGKLICLDPLFNMQKILEKRGYTYHNNLDFVNNNFNMTNGNFYLKI